MTSKHGLNSFSFLSIGLLLLLLVTGAMASVAYGQAAPVALPYIFDTAAGTGTAGFAGDNGSATFAELNSPRDVAFDSAGNMYIADFANGRIREVNASSGYISTFAGGATQPAGTAAAGGSLCGASYPWGGMTPTAPPWNISGDGCLATQAYLNQPRGVAVDQNNNVYISEYGSGEIRVVRASDNTIWTIGGGQSSGWADGDAAVSAFNNPQALAITPDGNVLVADGGNNVIRKIDMSACTVFTLNASTGGPYPTGCITSTITGTANPKWIGSPVPSSNTSASTPPIPAGYSGDGQDASYAQLNGPYAVRTDGSGNIYIADTGNCLVREIAKNSNLISTAIGDTANLCKGTRAGKYWPAVGNLSNAPAGLAIDGSGNIYVEESTSVVFYDAATQYVHKLAGGGPGCVGLATSPYDGCPGLQAAIGAAYGLALDSAGNVFLADAANNSARELMVGTVFPSTVMVGSSATLYSIFHLGAGDNGVGYVSSLPEFMLTSTGTNSFGDTLGCGSLNADDTVDCLVEVAFTPDTGGQFNGTLTATAMPSNQTKQLPETGQGVVLFQFPPYQYVPCSLEPGPGSPIYPPGYPIDPITGPGNTTYIVVCVFQVPSMAMTYGGPVPQLPTMITVPGNICIPTRPCPALVYNILVAVDCMTTATSQSPVGSYAINCSVPNPPTGYTGAYIFDIIPGTMQVLPATPAIGVTCGTFAYDGNPHGCTAKAVGVGGATVSGSFNWSPAQSETAPGTYDITATFTSNDPNYNNGSPATGLLIITPAVSTTVTASVTAANRQYNATVAATITSCSLSGVAPGDVGNVTCSAAGPNTFSDKNAGTNKTVTATNISLSGSAAGNYVLANTTATTTASISRAPVTPVFVWPLYIPYGGPPPSPSCMLEGVFPGDIVGCKVVVDVTMCVIVGPCMVSYSVILTGPDAGNYYVAGGFPPYPLTISKAPLTITAGNVVIPYGGPVPTPTCTVTGAVNGDVIGCTAVVSGTSTVPTASGAALANYSITVVDGTVTTGPATPNVSITCGTFAYNGAAHMCSATVTGVNGVAVNGKFTYSPAQSETAPGTYNITATFASSNANYSNGSPATGLLVINARPLEVNPTSIDFVNTYIGSASIMRTVAVINDSGAAITLNPATITGLDAGDFTMVDNCASKALPAVVPFATCTVQVTFKPLDLITSSSLLATLNITAVPSGAPQASLSASVALYGASKPLLLVQPGTLVFPSTYLSASSGVQTVTVTNDTGGPVQVSASLSGTDPGDFAISQNHCASGTIDNLGTCTISVTFTPTKINIRTALLVITAGGITKNVSLRGTGTAWLTVLPSSIPAFAATAVGKSESRIVTVGYNSTIPMDISIVPPGEFAITNTVCTAMVPGTACTYTLTFTPAAAGLRTATMTITGETTSGEILTWTTSLSGTGLN